MAKLTKFQKLMEEHLVSFKEEHQYLPPMHPQKRWEYLEVADNLYPPIRHGFMQHAYDYGLEFHDYARHVRSSQVFGFNVIYPIMKRDDHVSIFSHFIPIDLKFIQKWFFEYQPENNELGEWSGKNKPLKYVTSVDFALFGIDINDNKVAVLIEVKFTENKFTVCGGYNSNGNAYKDFCDENFCCSDINERCYLIAKKYRKYFDYVIDIYSWDNGRCPFRDNNQCMRNHAFAKALVANKIVDESYFGILYHEDNADIKKQWEEYKEYCVDDEKKRLFEIKSNDLVRKANDPMLEKYYKDRYSLRAVCRTRRST